jgi:hypothetical protein
VSYNDEKFILFVIKKSCLISLILFFPLCSYGEAISSIKWHQTLNSTEPKLITADGHVVRIWDPNTVSYYILQLQHPHFTRDSGTPKEKKSVFFCI